MAAFRLTMDLPYFALRSSDTPILDTHLRGNGKSLRQCEDVTFLKAEPSDSLSRHYLYEAHFSCIVSGTHNSRWKACAFGDTYHENEVQDLEPDPTNPEQGLEDPMRPNKLMDNVIMDPRHYYLDVFAAQIRYISGEWREIRDHVCHNTNDSVSISSSITAGISRRIIYLRWQEESQAGLMISDPPRILCVRRKKDVRASEPRS